jgi:hypothetical protein
MSKGGFLLKKELRQLQTRFLLKGEIMSFKKELMVLKKVQEDLSTLDTVAKEESKGLEKQLGKYSKPVWRELEIIMEREFNIKQPNYYDGDICGNEA